MNNNINPNPADVTTRYTAAHTYAGRHAEVRHAEARHAEARRIAPLLLAGTLLATLALGCIPAYALTAAGSPTGSVEYTQGQLVDEAGTVLLTNRFPVITLDWDAAARYPKLNESLSYMNDIIWESSAASLLEDWEDNRDLNPATFPMAFRLDREFTVLRADSTCFSGYMTNTHLGYAYPTVSYSAVLIDSNKGGMWIPTDIFRDGGAPETIDAAIEKELLATNPMLTNALYMSTAANPALHDKIMDALANVCSKYTVNPIKAMLETCHDNWDGNKHVENLLPNMLGAEKSEYTTAVMRLIMMGAVARVYHPGCKFDYMMVLVSDQGIGKSTFLRLLCINDAWFNDNFSTLDGDKAVEKLRGMWIVELAELQATKRTKDVETIKAFITSRVDTYRTPYARRTEQRPRMCILCGTSNPTDFLTDRTGNRRFLPITCGLHPAKYDMFADEAATRMEFAQAWGEIMDEYLRKGGKVSLVLPKRLQHEAINMQERYMEEDPRVGIIQEWLDNTEHARVCSMMLWREALKIEYAEPRAADIRAIHDIMRNAVVGWLPVGRQRCGDYGVQRCYEKEAKFEEIPENEENQLPFN